MKLILLMLRCALLGTVAIPIAHATTAPFCKKGGLKEPAAYVKSQEFFATELFKFANTPAVASQADHTLSKLLSAKSPAITEWMRGHGAADKDEDSIVREWRAYYAKNFVLNKYPQPETSVNQQIESLMDRTYQTSLPKDQRARFSKIFSEVQATALKRIAQWDLPQNQKQAITERIQTASLYWMDAFKGSKYEFAPLEAVSWGVAYDPTTNKINMGIEALRYPSDATLFAVFAHELGHAFDPCRWSAGFKGVNPFSPVIECLREPASAGAKRRDDKRLDEFASSGRIPKELRDSLKANPTCNKAAYPPIGIQSDQILESFADWFAAEVTAISPYAAKAVRSDLCDDEKLNAGSAYPSNTTRLERIYLAQPQLRKAQGLGPLVKDWRYCSLPAAK